MISLDRCHVSEKKMDVMTKTEWAFALVLASAVAIIAMVKIGMLWAGDAE